MKIRGRMNLNPCCESLKLALAQTIIRDCQTTFCSHNWIENLIFYLKTIQMTLYEVISKYDKQKAMWRRVCDDQLMYTKEERIEAAHYMLALSAIITDLKKIE